MPTSVERSANQNVEDFLATDEDIPPLSHCTRFDDDDPRDNLGSQILVVRFWWSDFDGQILVV